jgi:hypothetical protein
MGLLAANATLTDMNTQTHNRVAVIPVMRSIDRILEPSARACPDRDFPINAQMIV